MRLVRLLLCAAVVSGCTRAPRVESLATPTTTHPQAADVALAYDATTSSVLMSWVAGDSAGYHLYVARSPDGGRTWATPARVTSNTGEVKPHAEASPRLVARGNFVGVFWPRQHHVAGRRFPASQMRFARSADGGRTWSAPVTLNDDSLAGPASHTFHGAVLADDSTIAVAWLDSRQPAGSQAGAHHGGSSVVYTTISRDLGMSWPGANRAQPGAACPCCRVALAATGDGQVFATWRGHFDGDERDPVIARVAPAAIPLERVHADKWVFPACPHSGPALAVDAEDNVHVAWFTGAQDRAGVYYARAQAGERLTFDEPVPVLSGTTATSHPAICTGGGTVFIAVNAAASGKRSLTIGRIDGEHRVVLTEVEDSNNADHPSIIALPGQGALVAWTEKGERNQQVRLARIR